METILINSIGKVREDFLNGRKHLVAPVSMIKPGVLNGSQGPIFYPLEELQKNVTAWNSMPLVVFHPKAKGRSISARSPDILNTQGVGQILNAHVNGKLQAEAWFDLEALEKIDDKFDEKEKMIPRLRNGEPIELSTGLGMDKVKADEGSEFEGIKFTHIATNLRPDHLAILPNQTGACSVEDGCGVLVNESTEGEPRASPESLSKSEVESLIKEQVSEVRNQMDKEKLVDDIISNCSCFGKDDRDTLMNMNDDQLTLIKNTQPGKKQKELFKEEMPQTPKEFVDNLGNTHKFCSEKNEWITVPKPEEKVENKEEEVEVKPKTIEEFFAEAPPEVRSVFDEALGIQNQQKQAIITELVANVADDKKESYTENLSSKSLDELRMIQELAPAPKPKTVPSYFGMNTPSTVTNTPPKKPKPLTVPTIDWKELSKVGN